MNFHPIIVSCQLREIILASDDAFEVYLAGVSGNIKLCREQIAKNPILVNAMLAGTIVSNNIDHCKLAHALGATEFDVLMQVDKEPTMRRLGFYWQCLATQPSVAASMWYAALVLCTDEYFKVSNSEPILSGIKRFLRIATKLPQELQGTLCHRLCGSANTYVTNVQFDIGLHHLDKYWGP